MKLNYCCMSLNPFEIESSYGVFKDVIERVTKYVDRTIIVDGGSTDGSIEWLKECYPNVEVYFHKWEDNFPKQRNNYLSYVNNNEWVIVSDPDELYSELTMSNIRQAIEQCENNGFDMIMPRCYSVEIDRSKNIVYRNFDEYWKNLIFKKYEGTHYDGFLVHETLWTHKDSICWKAVKSDMFTYEHIKLKNIIWVKGARNAFCGGSGDNLGEQMPIWRPFRDLWNTIYNVSEWNEVLKIIKKGKIDPKIKDFLIEHRQWGKDGKYPDYPGSSEWREWYKMYFRFYHPEEEPEELKGEYIE